MDKNIYCEGLNGTNLDNPAELSSILANDKHTRIEGLCSEAAFMEDVVAGNLAPVTGDFWFKKNGYRYDVYKIITNLSAFLNELDYRVLDGFASGNQALSVYIVYFDESQRSFLRLQHIKGTRYSDLAGKGTIMHPAGKAVIAPISDRNPERIRKACDYLHKRGLLKDAAIKRLFANCWLDGLAVWDVDAFTITSHGQVIALEVKQKFPSKAKSFGINKGQVDLFGFLTSLGMPVIHIVLKKPVDNPDVHAIDLLTEEIYLQDTQWLYTRFLPQKLRPALAKAPRYTSIFGEYRLTYSHIPLTQFEELKKYGAVDSQVRSKLLKGLE